MFSDTYNVRTLCTCQCRRLRNPFPCYLALLFLLKVCPDMPQSDLSVQRNLYQDRQEIGCVIRFNWENQTIDPGTGNLSIPVTVTFLPVPISVTVTFFKKVT